MKQEFHVKIEKDSFDNCTYLSTSRNGKQWSSIPIPNPDDNIEKIIAALYRYSKDRVLKFFRKIKIN